MGMDSVQGVKIQSFTQDLVVPFMSCPQTFHLLMEVYFLLLAHSKFSLYYPKRVRINTFFLILSHIFKLGIHTGGKCK